MSDFEGAMTFIRPVLPGPTTPGFGETFGAAAMLSPYVQAFQRSREATTPPEPGYNPFAQDEIKGFEAYADAFVNVQSRAEAEALRTRIRQNEERRRVVEDGSWTASFLADTVLDPINLLPLPIARGLSVGRAALMGGAAVGAATAATEGLRLASDPTSTWAEAGSAVVFSSLFGAALGGIGARLSASEIQRASRLLEADLARLEGSPDAPPGGRPSPGQAAPSPVADTASPAAGEARGAEFVAQATEGDAGLAPALGGAERLASLGGTSTMGRIANAPYRAVNDFGARVTGDFGLMTRGNLAGKASEQSAFLAAMMWRGAAYDAVRSVEQAWGRYIAGGEASRFGIMMQKVADSFRSSRPDGKMTLREFNEAVFRAHKADRLEADDPAVLEAAKSVRAMFDRARDEGAKVGFLRTSEGSRRRFQKNTDRANTLAVEIRTLEAKTGRTANEDALLRVQADEYARVLGELEDAVDQGLALDDEIARTLDGINQRLAERSERARDLADRIEATIAARAEKDRATLGIFERRLAERGLTPKEQAYYELLKAKVGERRDLDVANLPDEIDGVEIVQGPTGKAREDGTPVLAFYDRAENRIRVDVDGLAATWADKPWRDPKVPGVKALPDDLFPTPAAWVEFVIRHELAHSRAERPMGTGWIPGAGDDVEQTAVPKIAEPKDLAGELTPTLRSYIEGMPGDKALAREYSTARTPDQERAFWTPANIERLRANQVAAPEDIVVYRGSLPDEDFSEGGRDRFFSTSLSAEWADVMGGAAFGGEQGLSRIIIRKGTPIIPINAGEVQEYEIIIAPEVMRTARLTNERRIPVYGDDDRELAVKEPRWKGDTTTWNGFTEFYQVREFEIGTAAASAPQGAGPRNRAGQRVFTEADKAAYENRINEIAAAEMREPGATPRQAAAIEGLRATAENPASARQQDYIKDMNNRLNRGVIEFPENPADKFYLPRVFRYDLVSANPDGLVAILAKRMPEEEAKSIVASMLKGFDPETGMAPPGFVSRGNGYTRFNMARKLRDFSNEELADFLETDITALTRTYADRFGRGLEFARAFGGDPQGQSALADVLMQVARESKGVSADEIMKEIGSIRGDLEFLRDTGLGTVHDPSLVNQRTIAATARNAVSVTTGGTFGLSALTEIARPMMVHGISRTFGFAFNGLAMSLDSYKDVSGSLRRLVGEGVDTALNLTPNHVSQGGNAGPTSSKALNAFNRFAEGPWYVINGLAPVTDMLKRYNLVMGNQFMLEDLAKVAAGKADDKLIARVASYGLSADDARQIMAQPIDKAGAIWKPNVQAWDDDDLVRRYAGAISGVVRRTIVTPGVADGPDIARGFIGKDKRREFALVTLPFQFMQYTFAATNKLLVSGLQGRDANFLGGMLPMIGMGLVVSWAKSSSQEWGAIPFEEKMIRAVDQSGVLPIISDINTMTENVSQGTLGLRPALGMRGRNRDPDMFDSVGEIGGPFVGKTLDILQLFVDGDTDTADVARTVRRSLPFNNLFYLRDVFRGAERMAVDTFGP